MLHLKDSSFTIIPDKKVIKADEYASLVKAHEIIEAAQKKADEIVGGAQNAFEKERKKGYEKGLEEGQSKIAEHMLESISRAVANVEKFEEDIIEVVIRAIKAILGEIDQTELITRVVKRSLQAVRNQKQVTLRCAPSQNDILNEKLAEILAEFPGISFIDVIPDERIEAGSCMIETPNGAVDGRLETQLDAIRKSLTKAIK